MALIDVIRLLTDTWDEVRPLLDPERGAELTALAGRFADEGDEGERRHIARDIADLLRAALPADHPIRRELRGGDRFAPPRAEWMAVAERLAHRADPSRVTAAEVVAGVSDHLRGVPTVAAEAEGDLDDSGLIKVLVDGKVRLPSFQFSERPGVRSVITEVNRILDVADDPYGALAWWTGGNARFGGRTPVEALDDDPAAVADAARALGEGP
ncbi:hypothetical protein [Thermomonospora umbrina]|uniref:Uncharacterized protein n=1 Tax=Thermomonospora umbrina TaxID=111806 RepID=A0A3D9SW37_9ACTN|nr:hypothetical protein [Thermomonospora umbrina]REE97205.1 hypothetical protein DFJ69_2667 [Thermomonospora umbrina]